MAYTPIYTPKNFTDWGPPDLDASNLNDIEAALVSLGNGLQTAAADTDTNTATIATINGEISDLNDLIDSILPDDSTSGNPAVITDAFGGECKSLILTLEPIQSGSGTPSPANPRPITGRTQSTATRTGKNICSVNSGNNLIIARVKNGVTYTFSIRNRGNCGFNLKKESNSGAVVVASLASTDPVISVSFTADSDFNIFLNGYGGGGYTFVDSAYDYQLEIGATATAYEAYNAESITRVYGQTLYGAKDDAVSGTVSNKKGVAIANDWNTFYGTSAGGLYWADLTIANIDTSAPAIASMLPWKDSGAAWYSASPCFTFSDDDKIRVYVTETTLADFKANYQNLQIVYELATPVIISLTPQNLTLLKGDNVITTDADNVDVEYKADIALYITKQLGGNLGNRGAKSAPAEEPADDPKEEEKTDDEIIEPVTKEAKK